LNNYYTTPNKLFEYIAVGLPVAGSAFPEIKRFVDGHELGVTFDPEDSASIGAAINDALRDPDRLAAMRANALAASRTLAWASEAAKLLALYADQITASDARTALPPRRA
jgi:glycosyltransferase involved in cell wall biosynthesis